MNKPSPGKPFNCTLRKVRPSWHTLRSTTPHQPSRMHHLKLFFALLASSSVLALPFPDGSSDDDCIGSSFSPTNCNSPGAQSIDISPDIDVSPDINLRDVTIEVRDDTDSGSDDDCIGSSFSPTNCNSPGAQSINVDPTVNVSPTVDTGDLLGGLGDLLGGRL